MSSFVLDASVAAKWVLPTAFEPLAADALRLLDGYTGRRIELLVPDLFGVEIGNVLWKAVRREILTQQLAETALDRLDTLAIPSVSTQPLVKPALKIACSHRYPIYDCFYVALAAESGRPLLTADEKLVNALGSRFPIRWLGAIL